MVVDRVVQVGVARAGAVAAPSLAAQFAVPTTGGDTAKLLDVDMD